MRQETWADVDNYFNSAIVPEAKELDWIVQENAKAGLPAIDVTANQAKLLNLLIRIHGAKSVLEIGTLGGYSTAWISRALPDDGRLVTLELEPAHAHLARANLSRAGVKQEIDLRIGLAVDSLAKLVAEQSEPFDFVFVDADKAGLPNYLEWSLKLTRPGSVIVFDNVVRGGEVLNAESDDENVIGVRRLIELLSSESRLSVTAIQTVGSKGYDGFALALVL